MPTDIRTLRAPSARELCRPGQGAPGTLSAGNAHARSRSFRGNAVMIEMECLGSAWDRRLICSPC